MDQQRKAQSRLHTFTHKCVAQLYNFSSIELLTASTVQNLPTVRKPIKQRGISRFSTVRNCVTRRVKAKTGTPTAIALVGRRWQQKIAIGFVRLSFRTSSCRRHQSTHRSTAIRLSNHTFHTRRLSHTTRNGTLRYCATRTSRQTTHS